MYISSATHYRMLFIAGVVVTGPSEWLVQCCGVITYWEVKAALSGTMEFQVWEILDEGNREAMMLGSNEVEGSNSQG